MSNYLVSIAAAIMTAICLPHSAYAKLPVVQLETPYPSSYIFVPNDGKPHPGIVVLHGSEGGSARNMWVHALLLAESGFTVMNYCWWDCGRDLRSEPPPLLADVELTKTVNAIDWFRKSSRVSKEKAVGLYGISKGAEQAMLLASYEERLPFKIGALVAHSPTYIIEHGTNINWLDVRCWICKVGEKECSYRPDRWNNSCGKIGGDFKPGEFDSLPMWQWNGVRLKLGDRIELEKYGGPILITAGDNDNVWTSDRNRVKRIQAALKKADRNAEVRIFRGQGHSFDIVVEQKRKALVDRFFHRAFK